MFTAHNMPQGAPKLKKTVQQKKQAANRHGKGAVTKKGKLQKVPKKATLVKQYNEEKELTKMINARNEGTAAGMAAKGGGKLNVVKPPVLASANEKSKKGKADKADKADAMEL